MDLCGLSDCTGCFACMNVCPKGAITSTIDKYGKTIPFIDNQKCISCGQCRKVCPVLNPLQLNKAKSSFAVWSRDEKDVRLSSSGGAASVFSKCVIKNSGIVYGCTSCEGTAKHIAVDTLEDIDRLRGSKYVQSDIGMVYRDVQAKLNDGKTVLFIGTPCQIAGLKGYLGKEYVKLITIDLICHGTPPISYLQEHIKSKVKNEHFDFFSFRGEYDWILTVSKKDKIIYKYKRDFDEYFLSFLDALTYRDNCYSCRYARPERVSDITVGDFWGIDRTTLKTPYKGRISVVLPNTDKGKAFFDSCKEGFVYEERSFDEAANSKQGNLLHPSTPHQDRKIFLENYLKDGFDKAVMKTGIGRVLIVNRFKRVKNMIKMQIKHFI
ncbi:Coenzyme F420 hydrogenase/dehydrogenase, beta subunit C-terminal domain [Mediterraneibacter faecis]|uniref:Coenzyme F420 hydrogenase/dehydrogenase, beta subunit C-terminal domain n=1 Tax=Mediterraneibacter faecis TaxID=592978 RepID=UPI003F994D3C